MALLLEEYRALRAEQLAHIGIRGNLLAFGGIAVVLAAGLKGAGGTAFWIAMLCALLLGGRFYASRIAAMTRLGAHLADIERRLNSLAETAYGCSSPLLSWETNQRNQPLRLTSPLWWVLRKSR